MKRFEEKRENNREKVLTEEKEREWEKLRE